MHSFDDDLFMIVMIGVEGDQSVPGQVGRCDQQLPAEDWHLRKQDH